MIFPYIMWFLQGLDGSVKETAYLSMKNPRQGGFTATLFIFGIMFLDNIGFVANMMSFVVYFATVMHFDLAGAATNTTNFLGTAFLVTIIGGFISDAYMTRLNTTLLFGIIQLLGYLLLIIQSHSTKLQPQPCGESTCVHSGKALLLYTSVYLTALGAGGIRGCIPALGPDQFDENDPKESSKNISSFFNWFLLSITMGASVGVTVVVWVSTNVGWDKGFIISMVCCFAGLCFVSMGKPFHKVRVPGESPLLSVLVLVAAARNWSVQLPTDKRQLYEIRDPNAVSLIQGHRLPHTHQFRVLDKAAVQMDGTDKQGKWRLCPVTQVEEVKILTRMMPILLSTIIMNTCLAQLQTISVQQGTLMDPSLGKFDVPAASIPVIPPVFMSVLIPIYEFLFVPVIRMFTGHPTGITHLQRVGVGLVLSAISMAIAGAVEVKRKNEFNHHNHRTSVFWLSFHYAIFGIADMFTLVGLMEFFYSEAPAGMRSLSTSFSFLSLSIGYYLSSAFVELINSITSKLTSNKQGWVQGRDMNKNHIELFYWFLAILSLLNFGNYVFWANWYKYKKDSPIDEQKLLHPALSVTMSMTSQQAISTSEGEQKTEKTKVQA
ncbi:protein NRT1/ PTR FAMILY 4.5-like [Lycium ferocissimum]|uniref:protein NRT1/ PTR FAMILY 4.5-like n=1 Tax=Lycium ferocissimum TaxID=112874 RepID=UPI0028156548|nr:protein NRT1/ PTR FAMILY 4.5-like [Lycium ferocissimum]